MTLTYTLRWTLYARSLGVEPEDLQPGGRTNAGFINWIHQAWRDWKVENGRKPDGPSSADDDPAFDAWLASR